MSRASARNNPSISWDTARPLFTALYREEKLSFEECISAMTIRHGFTASRSTYFRKVREWGLAKNVKDREMRVAFRKVVQRLMEGKDTKIKVRGVEITRYQLKRFMRRELIKRRERKEAEMDNIVRESKQRAKATVNSWMEGTPAIGFRAWTPEQRQLRGVCSPSLFGDQYCSGSIMAQILNNTTCNRVDMRIGPTEPTEPTPISGRRAQEPRGNAILLCMENEFRHEELSSLGSFVIKNCITSDRASDAEVMLKVSTATQIAAEVLRRLSGLLGDPHFVIFPKASDLYRQHCNLKNSGLQETVAVITCSHCKRLIKMELGHSKSNLSCYLESINPVPTLVDLFGQSLAIFSYGVPSGLEGNSTERTPSSMFRSQGSSNDVRSILDSFLNLGLPQYSSPSCFEERFSNESTGSPFSSGSSAQTSNTSPGSEVPTPQTLLIDSDNILSEHEKNLNPQDFFGNITLRVEREDVEVDLEEFMEWKMEQDRFESGEVFSTFDTLNDKDFDPSGSGGIVKRRAGL